MCPVFVEVLAKVYGIKAKEQKMAPDQRLGYYKKDGGPLMTELKSRLNRQTEENLVKPNPGLGKAITYMKKPLGQIDPVFSNTGSASG